MTWSPPIDLAARRSAPASWTWRQWRCPRGNCANWVSLSVIAECMRGDVMDGIADMGGTPGWGVVHPPRPDEPVFAEPWQSRAFALALLSSRIACGGYNPGAFRHAMERLDRTRYLDDGYFGRWLNCAELMLTDSATLAPGAIDARARNLRGEQAEEPPVPAPRPDYAPTAAPVGAGSLRSVDTA